MSDKDTINTVDGKEIDEMPVFSNAYMDRMFCSTKERVTYILKSSTASLSMGAYNTDTEWYLYKIFGLQPTSLAQANIGLGIYDMINDPLSAAIIDNMRSRWGKFKPFQYLALIPSVILGIIGCLMPLIADARGMDVASKLVFYMIIAYMNETVGAFFGGGGYIDNVFTPNPKERTSLLVSAKFVSEMFAKFPEQLAGLIIDLIINDKLKLNLVKVVVSMKTFWWVVITIPSILWVIVSKERVPQSAKPPQPLKGLASVFRNRPLLIYTLSGLVSGINVGAPESLYYSDVLKFTMLPTIAGIPGMPISYASYPIATKLREKFSTKALWLMQAYSISASESLFFIVGLMGGKKNGLYKKKVPMTIAAAIGNCIEMFFYGTKKVVGTEINFEVLDYCEWKNGYRVEATINLLQGYFNKVKNIILQNVNAYLLEAWAGFEIGVNAQQNETTQWRMFLTACGPKLIFGLLATIPMFFYNIDKKTRARMYYELERARAQTAAREKRIADSLTEEN